FTTRRRMCTRVRQSSTQHGERSRAKRRSPPPRAAGNLRRRERASMQRRICRRSTNVRSRLHTARTRAPVASVRESTQRIGFVVRERSIGLTPRVQLRACPAPSHLNCYTSSHQRLHTNLAARLLQRFVIRPAVHATQRQLL